MIHVIPSKDALSALVITSRYTVLPWEDVLSSEQAIDAIPSKSAVSTMQITPVFPQEITRPVLWFIKTAYSFSIVYRHRLHLCWKPKIGTFNYFDTFLKQFCICLRFTQKRVLSTFITYIITLKKLCINILLHIDRC